MITRQLGGQPRDRVIDMLVDQRDRREIARDLEPAGLLLNSPRPDLLRFMPALNLSTDEIDLMLSLLSDVVPLAKKHS